MDLVDQEVLGHEADLLIWEDAGCKRTPEEAVTCVGRVTHVTGPAPTPREFFIVCGFHAPQWGFDCFGHTRSKVQPLRSASVSSSSFLNQSCQWASLLIMTGF